jgi:hypothetical protein
MVILLGVDPELDQPQRFLVRLAGLVKRALRSEGGRIDLSALAAATAQREETVRAGIAWLAARGDVVVLADPQAPQELGTTRQELRLAAGEGETAAGRDRHVDRSDADLARAVTQLRSLLEETAAYRAYFARADAEVLIDNARSG